MVWSVRYRTRVTDSLERDETVSWTTWKWNTWNVMLMGVMGGGEIEW